MIEIVAHRTNPLAAPENTVPGILSVPATGATAVEIDIRWSSTNFPVLMHDRTVDRTTPSAGAVNSFGLGQLLAMKATDYAPWKNDSRFSGTKIPDGNMFMQAVQQADVDLLVDVGDTLTEVGMEKLRIYVADYYGWAGRSRFMGSAAMVKQMKQWEPSLTYMLIEYPPADMVRSGESIRSLGVATYAVPNKAITAAAVAYWHSYGISVATWTSDPGNDTETEWRRVADCGIDTLVTDRPAQARAALS